MRDLVSVINPLVALTSANIQATTAGASIPTTGYEGVAFAIFVASLGDTLSGSKSYEFDIQESVDGSTWTAVDNSLVQNAVNGQYGAGGAANSGAGALLNSGAASSAAQVLKAGYTGNKPFVRLNVVVVGTMTTGTVISAAAILGHARRVPAGSAQLP